MPTTVALRFANSAPIEMKCSFTRKVGTPSARPPGDGVASASGVFLLAWPSVVEDGADGVFDRALMSMILIDDTVAHRSVDPGWYRRAKKCSPLGTQKVGGVPGQELHSTITSARPAVMQRGDCPKNA